MPVSLPLLSFAGTPDDGVNEVQLLTPGCTATGGYFTLTFSGQTTGHIAYNAPPEDVQAALEALSNIGADGVVVTGDDPDDPTLISDGGVYTVTFSRHMGGINQPEMTADDSHLTGASAAITPSTDTTGAPGTYRGAQPGALLQDTDNGVIYINTGTAYTPDWSRFDNLGA